MIKQVIEPNLAKKLGNVYVETVSAGMRNAGLENQVNFDVDLYKQEVKVIISAGGDTATSMVFTKPIADLFLIGADDDLLDEQVGLDKVARQQASFLKEIADEWLKLARKQQKLYGFAYQLEASRVLAVFNDIVNYYRINWGSGENIAFIGSEQEYELQIDVEAPNHWLVDVVLHPRSIDVMANMTNQELVEYVLFVIANRLQDDGAEHDFSNGTALNERAKKVMEDWDYLADVSKRMFKDAGELPEYFQYVK